MSDRLLNAAEVSEILGMTKDYVYSLCRQDKIPHLRFGKTIRFRAGAIDDWLSRSERGSLEAQFKRPGASGIAPAMAQED